MPARIPDGRIHHQSRKFADVRDIAAAPACYRPARTDLAAEIPRQRQELRAGGELHSQLVRIVDGHFQDGYTAVYELVCPGCGDRPHLHCPYPGIR
jgi:hypothetical protein